MLSKLSLDTDALNVCDALQLGDVQFPPHKPPSLLCRPIISLSIGSVGTVPLSRSGKSSSVKVRSMSSQKCTGSSDGASWSRLIVHGSSSASEDPAGREAFGHLDCLPGLVSFAKSKSRPSSILAYRRKNRGSDHSRRTRSSDRNPEKTDRRARRSWKPTAARVQ